MVANDTESSFGEQKDHSQVATKSCNCDCHFGIIRELMQSVEVCSNHVEQIILIKCVFPSMLEILYNILLTSQTTIAGSEER